MNHSTWKTVLANVLGRERRSLMQFITDAYPWTRQAEQDLAAQLQKMVQEEQQAAIALANFLERRRVELPYAGPFPLSYTSLLFVSLDYLLPHVIADQRKSIAALQADLAVVTDAEARQPLERMLAIKQRDLKQLEELVTTSAKAHV